jgi:hypothetical protein
MSRVRSFVRRIRQWVGVGLTDPATFRVRHRGPTRRLSGSGIDRGEDSRSILVTALAEAATRGTGLKLHEHDPEMSGMCFRSAAGRPRKLFALGLNWVTKIMRMN